MFHRGVVFDDDGKKIYNENVVDLLTDPSARSNSADSPVKKKTSPRARQGSNSVSPTVSPAAGGGGGAFSDGKGKPTIRENKVGTSFLLYVNVIKAVWYCCWKYRACGNVSPYV